MSKRTILPGSGSYCLRSGQHLPRHPVSVPATVEHERPQRRQPIAGCLVALPRLAPAFEGYRLVQLSDLHMDDWMTPDRLAGAIALVNAEAPAAVAITGDFVTHEPRRFAPHLVEILRGLRARDVTTAVLGNHDHWTEAAVVRQVLVDSGIVDVSNGVQTVRRGRRCRTWPGSTTT